MQELIGNVLAWADERGLLDPEYAVPQAGKMMEEATELLQAIVSADLNETMDGIGDVLVTLIIIAEQHGMTLEECLRAAWNEIKDRRGRTVNGVFVKEQ